MCHSSHLIKKKNHFLCTKGRPKTFFVSHLKLGSSHIAHVAKPTMLCPTKVSIYFKWIMFFLPHPTIYYRSIRPWSYSRLGKCFKLIGTWITLSLHCIESNFVNELNARLSNLSYTLESSLKLYHSFNVYQLTAIVVIILLVNPRVVGLKSSSGMVWFVIWDFDLKS